MIDENNVKEDKKNLILSVLCGIITGLVNGLFGGGGGMIVVPFLISVLNYKVKVAHATAISIILPMSIVSSLLYTGFKNLKFNVALPVSIGVTLGGLIGAFLLKKISSKWLIVVFSIVMIIAGGKMLFF